MLDKNAAGHSLIRNRQREPALNTRLLTKVGKVGEVSLRVELNSQSRLRRQDPRTCLCDSRDVGNLSKASTGREVTEEVESPGIVNG